MHITKNGANLGIHPPQNACISIPKDSCKHVNSSLVHNFPKLEATQMPINTKMNK